MATSAPSRSADDPADRACLTLDGHAGRYNCLTGLGMAFPTTDLPDRGTAGGPERLSAPRKHIGSPTVVGNLSGQDPLAALESLPGVRQSTVDTREVVDRLLGHRVLRRSSAAVSAESALRGARASAELAGAAYPLARVRDGTVEDPVVQGALRVSAALGSSVDTWGCAPLQVLARLHALAAYGLVATGDLGRPRPEHDAARLAALVEIAVRPTAAPAVVVAAVVHGELLALRPFGSADGVVARAAQRLVLVDRGLDPKAVTVPEVGHVELAGEYSATLQAYESGRPDGVAAWLQHCCQAVALGAREGLAVCEAVLRG